MTVTNKTILVVGGSGVIGGQFVSQLAAQGADVLATCSSPSSAERIPQEARLKLEVDLNKPSSIDLLAQYLTANVELDGIVLAAGRVGFGGASLTTPSQLAEMSQVNFVGQAHLVTALLGALRKGTEPFILAVTGVVAEKVFPGMHAYTASKTAFSAWLSSLRLEVRREGIQVLEARPPHTETGLAARPLFGAAPSMPKGLEPEHVVLKIIEALNNGETLLESAAF